MRIDGEAQPVVIQKVKHMELIQLDHLTEESSLEGFRHLNRLAAEYRSGANRFEGEGEALFIATIEGELIGVCGLNQDPYSNLKEQHVGRVRRMYVSPRVRRSGVGRMLMNAVIAEAKQHYSMLVLKTEHAVADHFYRSLGFEVSAESDDRTHYLKFHS